MIETFRTQTLRAKDANDALPEIILNAGDLDGRIVRFEAMKGDGHEEGIACKLWIDKGEGLAVFCDLEPVDAARPTFEAAIPVRGLDPGTYRAAIRVEDDDSSITESMPVKVTVLESILAESEASEEMQDALDDFETRTAIAITAANAATAAANSAAASAASAASDAYDAANRADRSRVAADTAEAARASAEEIRVAAEDARATAETARATAETARASAEAERQAAEALRASAETARTSAETARVSAETARASAEAARETASRQATEAANTATESATSAASSANSAAASATSAASGANSAATSATSAAETATGAAETATSAAGSASTAAINATSAANAANSAANSANSATTSANAAATSANGAAAAANTAAGNAATATENANSATTAATNAATSASNAATAASDAAEDATDAATEARDAAAAALASVGNVVLGEISMLDGSIETVDDAYVSPLRGIEVSGKSTQVSISGSQIWQPNMQYTSATGATCVVDDYDATVTAASADSGIQVSFVVPDYKFVAGSTLTLSADVAAGSDNYAGLRALDANNAQVELVRNKTTSTKLVVTLTIPEGTASVAALFYARSTASGSVGDECKYSNIMLNSGSTALPFEPYVGGIPSPNPDYPQTIHSVAEAGQVLTGRCVWGGEKMADDIVAAVGDSTKAYKGEDENGKFVVISASTAVQGKAPFTKFKQDARYTLVFRASTTASQRGLNVNFLYADGAKTYINLPEKAPNVIQFGAESSVANRPLHAIGLGWNTGVNKIYYERSGLFEGALTTADFIPYLGTTTPLIPSGTEPLRSLPNGVRDELRVHADGSGEIVRRVGTVVFDESRTYGLYTSGSYDGIYSTVPDMSRGDRQSGLSDKCVCALASRGLYAWLGVSNNVIYIPMLFNRTGIAHGDLYEWIAENPISFLYPLATPVIEPLPSLTMPSAPSSDVTAWLDSKDESSAPIAADSSVKYERSMQIVIDKLEQAIADL